MLVASNFGQHKHPAWYHNVMAHPEVTLYAGGYEGRFTGAPATGAERERLRSPMRGGATMRAAARRGGCVTACRPGDGVA